MEKLISVVKEISDVSFLVLGVDGAWSCVIRQGEGEVSRGRVRGCMEGGRR